jgi:hypothetical protein
MANAGSHDVNPFKIGYRIELLRLTAAKSEGRNNFCRPRKKPKLKSRTSIWLRWTFPDLAVPAIEAR